MKLVARLLGSRALMRAPVPIFRAGLGFLFLGRIMLLEHRGRRSGRTHRTALEVVGSDAPGSILVAAGFGASSDWYQNLAVEPRCRVTVGFHYRRPANAELLDRRESRALLAAYQERHPHLWRFAHRALAEVRGEQEPEIPLVRLSWRVRVKPSAPAVAPVFTPGR